MTYPKENEQKIFGPEVREILDPNFDFEAAISQAAENGYSFTQGAISPEVCEALNREAKSIGLVIDDRIANPIRAGRSNEVRQLHLKRTHNIGSPEIPTASALSNYLSERAKQLNAFPQLEVWFPTIGQYQRYPQGEGHITPHRDGESQALLCATITALGSADVFVYETLGESNDYRRENLRMVDGFKTHAGTLMLLSGPGLGNGLRVVHEVMPPEEGDRLILNLRMINKKM